ncbi:MULTISPECIES: hypothetical protein [Pseudanabaena]|uniref:Uncharacterized protein n=2 Tax=Pseudanabaena TaxID=1152 RepID=L8MWB7_9CYAN|nr:MULTISPECIES: hypothetical protein [Pseudanabaena]ELS31766.1 hypothetical protein Pse7429DRAFT_3278 [Pseudanabaena biceps PCC 7429]MDG3495989.1 hypothetical protein [Pseudanabaena catenata USMAC16]
MKFLLSIISASALLVPFTGSASAYSQDPRSCSDPRTQYPSNPPCQKQDSLINVYYNKVN